MKRRITHAEKKISDLEFKLKRAEAQRFIALTNAFKTIDSFIIPSGTPEDCEAYVKIRDYLLATYEIVDLKNYSFND